MVKSTLPDKNPFARPDGGPKPGMIEEFFNWNALKREEMLSNMSPEEKERWIAAEKHMSKKMNS